MTAMRITVKFFVEDPESVRIDELIPVFHGWIQKGTVKGLLLDVADYRHIHDGPGMILIGDQVDYSLDLGGGRPGLLVRRKYRGLDGVLLQNQVLESLSLGLHACHALESEPALQGRITFQTGEVEIAFPDRFHAPNTPEIFNEYIKELFPTLVRFYSREDIHFQRVSSDPREVFAIRVHIPESPGLTALIKHLETNEEV